VADIQALIHNLQVHQLELELQNDALVEQRLASDLWRVSADALQMSQVIVNLLSNAVEAGDGQSLIRVSTANVVIDQAWTAQATCCNLKPGRYVKLAVEDTGGGMSALRCWPEYLSHFLPPNSRDGHGQWRRFTGSCRTTAAIFLSKVRPSYGTSVSVYLPAA
jgi:hypothetical protein